jgi:hypothetical protein
MKIEWLNVVLAGVAFFAVAGSIAVMDKATRGVIRYASILIAAGLFAHGLGFVIGQWGEYANTLLFGGVAMLVLGSRKVPTCWLEQHAQQAAWTVFALTVTLTVTPGLVHAQGRGVQIDCGRLARLIDAASSYRDTGADLNLFIAWMHKVGADMPPAQREVLAREVRRMWKEKLPGEDAGIAVYTRCTQQLGDMGREG